jgi:hypothetical protein
MNNNVAILIECDNVRSLGGSCERDIYNIYNRLLSLSHDPPYNPRNIYILTNNINYFIKHNININLTNNSVKEFENILANLSNPSDQSDQSNVYIHISGHGYLGYDVRHIEISNYCEQIILSSGVLTDYNFNDILIKYLQQTVQIRISVDTCHSGTFSNFTYEILSNDSKVIATKKNPYFLNAYSISACKDNELDSCDISNVGYGGSLTVHLLDNNNFEEFLFGNPIKVKNELSIILKLLNQEPVLLIDN